MGVEICDVNFSIFDSEFGRLDVSVNETYIVELLKNLKHLNCNLSYHHLLVWWALRIDQVLQRFREIAHDDTTSIIESFKKVLRNVDGHGLQFENFILFF
jgi:hypothetical protein